MELENEWVRISDDSGSGDTQVTASVKSVNTGRLTRSVTLKGTTAHDATAVANIVQAGFQEFVQFDVRPPETNNITNNATYVTLTGKSNSKRLTFSFPGKDEIMGQQDFLVLPQSYMATRGSSVTVNNGSDLTPDLGAEGEYAFSITLPLKGTSPGNSRTEYVKVTSYGGLTDFASVTQAGIATTILFDGYQTGNVYDLTNTPVGGTQTINVGVTPSGEGWTLEFDE